MDLLTMDHQRALRFVADESAATRGALASHTGWSRGTVAQRLNELQAANWLVTDPTQGDTEQRGRPSTRYRLNPMGGLILVLAFGQTQVNAALIDLTGQAIAGKTIHFTAGREIEEANDTAGRADEIMNALLDEIGCTPEDVRLCVFGKPGPVDQEEPNAPSAMPVWLAAENRATIESRTGIPTVIENDVNLVALGFWAMNGRLKGTSVAIQVSIGMGAGIIVDGHLIRGRRGMAGEIGHLPISTPYAQLCGCGQSNCASRAVGIPRILELLRQQGLDAENFAELQALTERADPVAIAALRQAGRHIGEALLGLVATLAPDVVAIGGPLLRLGDYAIAGARETLYARSLPALTAGMKVVSAPNYLELTLKGASVFGIATLIDRARPLPDTLNLPVAIRNRPVGR